MSDIRLERIQMPSPDAFYEKYMRRLRPVAITNLFEGEPIRQIDSREKLIAAWGNIQIPLDVEYDDEIGIAQVRAQLVARQQQLAPDRAQLAHASVASIAEYFELLAASHGQQKPRIAFEPPAALGPYFRYPEVCRLVGPNESSEFTSCCFVGNGASFSHLHFDKDGQHGLLYQVYGLKRFIVIPQNASPKLAPFTQYSSWCLQSFSDADRQEFLEYTGGKEIVMGPGDTVYLPPYCWHFADYLEDCWSINMRFRRANPVTAVANALFPDMYAALIGTKLSDSALPESLTRSIVEELEAASRRDFRDGFEKVAAMRKMARALYARLFPEAPALPYAMDLEQHFPPPLPHLLDAGHPGRPTYR